MTVLSGPIQILIDSAFFQERRNRGILCVLGLVLVGLGFSGCSTPPPSQVDSLNVPIPERFTGLSNRASRATIDQQGWLHDFQAPQLESMVEESLLHNRNLQAVAARLDAARASQQIASSFRLPDVNATAGASRHQQVFETPGGRVENDIFNQHSLGLNLFWELDLWGKLKNRAQAAQADYQAAQADYRAAELSLAANTVKAWFNAVESELQVRLTQNTLHSFETNLVVVENSYRRGIRPALDVRLTRANVEAARSNLKLGDRLRDASARSLEVLLGRYPGNEIAIETDLPSLARDVPAGLPAELLQRRPDLVAAERRFAASLESLKESKKDFLPTISLTGSAGTSSEDLQDLLDVERLAWRIAGNLTQPVFQGGRLRANVQLSDAQSRQALALYADSALRAFQEVETFLAAEEFLKEQEQALRLAAEESGLAEALALQQYQRGLADIITVLESQRRAFNSRSALIQIVNDRLQNRVNLYLSLGGDFGDVETKAVGQMTELTPSPNDR